MAKKTAKKAEKNNVITEKIQKASETVTGKMKEINEKYLAETVEKGKKTIKEVNEKYVAKNIEKGRETFKEYNEKYIAKNIEKGKEYFEGPYKKVTETVDDVLAKGRDIEKDAMKKFDDALARSRKFMYKVPMVESVEKRVSKGLSALPNLVNMPSKGEIEQLTLAMKTLNTNIETLKKQKTV